MNHKNYINNEWVCGSTNSTFEVENPYTEEIIAKVPNSSSADVGAAVSAAKIKKLLRSLSVGQTSISVTSVFRSVTKY